MDQLSHLLPWPAEPLLQGSQSSEDDIWTRAALSTSLQLPGLPRRAEPSPWSFEALSALGPSCGGVSLASASFPSAAPAAAVAQSTGAPGAEAGNSGSSSSSGGGSGGSSSSAATDGAAGGAAQAAAKASRSAAQKERNAAAARAKRERQKEERAAVEAELAAIRAENVRLRAENDALQPASEQAALAAAERAQHKAEKHAAAAEERAAAAQRHCTKLADAVRLHEARVVEMRAERRAETRAAGAAAAQHSVAEKVRLQLQDEAVARALQQAEVSGARERAAAEARADAAVAESKRAKSNEASALARASNAEAAQQTAEATARAGRKRARAAVQELRKQSAGEASRTEIAVSGAIRAYAAMVDSSGAPPPGNGCANDPDSGSDSDAGVATTANCTHRRKRIRVQATSTELAFLCRQGKGKRGAFPDAVKLLAAKWASGGASYEQCANMYRDFVQVLAGVSCAEPQDSCFLRAAYFQRKLKQSRLMFMLANAVELAHAERRLSLSGDGASDRDIRKGLREFFVFVAEVARADGTTKPIYVDGALVSFGLTSQAEVDVAMVALARLRHVATVAKEEFARLYPSLLGEVDFLGRSLDIAKISVAHFHHVKADGAASAQKWARLLAAKVKAATRATFSDAEWAALKPEERHIALWVIVTNCTMHNFHLGGKHACKATSQLTVELSEPALESIRDAGFNTTSMEHAPSLSAATHTASKMWSTSESYAFGLAFFFKTHVAIKFPGRPYIAIPRVNGSRFMYQLIAASSFVFMHEQMQSCLGTQIFRNSHSKIVSTMWAQLSSQFILLEARVLEALFAMLFEPLQVMLGSPHSHYSNAGGESSSDTGGAGGGGGGGGGAGDDGVAALEKAVGEKGGAGGEQGIGSYEPFVNFWHGNAGKDGACPPLSAYKLSVDLPQRIELAELAAADDNIAALLAAKLSIDAATTDAAVCLMIDGGTDATPEPESCGIYFHIELFKCAIKMLAEIKRDPSILFRDERPSAKLAAFFPAVAMARLKLWENAAYRVAARDASGAVAAPSRREWLDTQRHLKQAAFDPGSAAQLAEYVDAAASACKVEWEKVMKQGLTGELAEPNRTAWQRDLLAECESHTMLCESGVGATKFARGAMGTGSTCRLKARAQASHSDPWELINRMSDEEQRVLLWTSENLESWIDAEDRADEKKEEEAATARKLKQQEKFIRAAAQEHADAIQLFKMAPWTLDSFADNLRMHKWIYSKVHAMARQMDIIVKGYGHAWLAYKHKRALHLSCSVCGCSLGKTNAEHLEHHLRHALTHGGKPAECPRPRITPKHVPPAMLANQEDNPAHAVIAKAAELAASMAESGEVGQTIGPVFGSDAEAPTIDDSLVDQVIEYTFEAVSTATKGSRKNQKKSQYVYVGIVCEVKAAVSSGVREEVASISGSGGKKKSTKQRGKKAASTDGFASVRVRWTERFEDDVEEGKLTCSKFVCALLFTSRCPHRPPAHSHMLPHSCAQSEWVYLIPDNFGKQRVDGWVCYPKHNTCASGAGADAEDTETKVERMRIDAEVLCQHKPM